MASKAELLAAIDTVASEIEDDTPTVTQVRENTEYSHNDYYDVFESWNDALRKAGYGVNQNMRAAKGNTEDLLDAIRELAEGDTPPTLEEINENGRYSMAAYYRYFDSYTEAVKEAGLEPRREPGKRIQKVCEICGDPFKVKPSISDQRFCGQDCHGKYRSEKYVGKDHWNYKERVTVECHYCGDDETREQWYVETHERTFCGDECLGNWVSERLSGEDHPRWNGGANLVIEYYGPEWDDIRVDVIANQHGKCRVCTRQEPETGSTLEVHHIRPVRDFKDDDGMIDWDSAHDKDNLCALCNKCHKRWEGLPVLPNGLGT